jgi:tetratricopeptide (TPR) repeat protein
MPEPNKTAKPQVKISKRRLERFAYGEISLSEFVGLSKRDLYAIAQVGYHMLSAGKLDKAQQIYEALVVADPFDSVFHCHLGAIYHKSNDVDKALAEYNKALQFNFANMDALVGRGEIYFIKGRLSDALTDLKASIDLDPKGNVPSTVRARAIIVAINEVAKKVQSKQATKRK